MNRSWRMLAVLTIGLCGSLWHALPVGAESWPSKTIRIIVPFPPGGTTDQIARRVQPLLERNLKTSIVIENRGGASGSIGTQAAVSAATGHADYQRTRSRGLRCRGLVGLARTGEDAVRDHRTDERGHGGRPAGAHGQAGFDRTRDRLSSPEAFGRFLENEIKRWAKVVKDNKIVLGE
jgi:tripartite-type tricarboxylate transporter receptor subunit TctC